MSLPIEYRITNNHTSLITRITLSGLSILLQYFFEHDLKNKLFIKIVHLYVMIGVLTLYQVNFTEKLHNPRLVKLLKLEMKNQFDKHSQ
jgi:hypothetical protein